MKKEKRDNIDANRFGSFRSKRTRKEKCWKIMKKNYSKLPIEEALESILMALEMILDRNVLYEIPR